HSRSPPLASAGLRSALSGPSSWPPVAPSGPAFRSATSAVPSSPHTLRAPYTPAASLPDTSSTLRLRPPALPPSLHRPPIADPLPSPLPLSPHSVPPSRASPAPPRSLPPRLGSPSPSLVDRSFPDIRSLQAPSVSQDPLSDISALLSLQMGSEHISLLSSLA